jgi:dipeptidyl aminopeptidase/acylaminoacyl peptidase
MRAVLLIMTALLVEGAPQLSGLAPSGRPMTIDDLITAVRVSDPQLSPDLTRVLYVRTTTDGKTGKRNADIWSVPADGSASPKEFIGGDAADTTPRYSTDGKHVAFISSRDGAPQVYVADANGGAARKVTALSMGVQPPLVFSADGNHVAFVSDVYPECTDEACNKRKNDEAEKDPVKVHRLTRLLYRHWDEWRENVRHHVFVADLTSGAALDVTPGDYDSPPGQQEDAAIAFSPDGGEIAFVSSREGADKEAWTTNHDVWVVPITGGHPRKITTNPASDLQPMYSRDGRTILVRAQRRPGFESDRWYLDAYDRESGAKRTLFTAPDLSVGDYSLSPDGLTIWFTASQQGREDLFTVPSAGGQPSHVLQGGSISAARPGSGFAVFSKSTLTSPPDLFRVAADGKDVRALTHENAGWLKDVAFAEPQSLTATSAAGQKIQYWLVKPPDFDPSKKYPVVFLLHGGPQGAWEDAWSTRWNPSLWAAQGWVIAAPNPRGSFGFGQTFVDQISGDWGGRAMTDIDAVVAAVSKMPFTDSQRMGIAGASFGGYAVDWIIGHTNRFKAAVTHDGVFNLESMSMATEELWFPEWEFGGRPWDPKARAQFAKWSPHLYAQNIKTPTLVITNEMDFRVPVDQGLQLFTVLRRNGVPSEALVFPDEGHWVLKALNSRVWHEAVFGWMRKYLSGSAVRDAGSRGIRHPTQRR